MIKSKGFEPSLEKAISDGEIKTFFTKKLALAAAKMFGWSQRVEQVERRFERVWIVGHWDSLMGELSCPVLRFNDSEQKVLRFARNEGARVAKEVHIENDKERRRIERPILQAAFPDYDPRYHDAFKTRYVQEKEDDAMLIYMKDRGII